MKYWIQLPKEKLIEKLWAAEPKIKSILQNSKHVEEARFIIFDYLNRLERDLFNMRSDTYFVNLNIIEKRNAKECIRVLSNVMRTENEYLTGTSLWICCLISPMRPRKRRIRLTKPSCANSSLCSEALRVNRGSIPPVRKSSK